MRKIMLLLLVVLTTVTQSQEKETRTLDDFTRISVSSGIDLYLTQAGDQALEVVCRKDILHKLITEVQGNTLKIYIKGRGGWNWGENSVPKVYVSFKELEELTASGGSDVYGQNVLEQPFVHVSSSGGSDVYLEVNTQELKLTTSGGADMKLKGTADKLIAISSGGSDINARELKAQFVKVTSSGGSDAVVWVEKEIVANASGGSDITFYGAPERKQLNESGAGDIQQR
ncbi:head GIN domain-containing protein [Carboxylicivirga taeanensis]|uniref:head GIN domain-containing protein n=1 Tax=Carboxylicivirga taeanensis TaxID=1416875 RepID=UPI003F6E2687